MLAGFADVRHEFLAMASDHAEDDVLVVEGRTAIS